MEQKMINTFRKTVENREYIMSFPMDTHIQELWDFVQEIANELITVNKRNQEIAQQSQEEAPIEVSAPVVQE